MYTNFSIGFSAITGNFYATFNLSRGFWIQSRFVPTIFLLISSSYIFIPRFNCLEVLYLLEKIVDGNLKLGGIGETVAQTHFEDFCRPDIGTKVLIHCSDSFLGEEHVEAFGSKLYKVGFFGLL